MNTALIGKASGAGNFIYQLYTHKMRHEIADTRRLGLKYKMHIQDKQNDGNEASTVNSRENNKSTK